MNPVFEQDASGREVYVDDMVAAGGLRGQPRFPLVDDMADRATDDRGGDSEGVGWLAVTLT
jgi:hypothetical protein